MKCDAHLNWDKSHALLAVCSSYSAAIENKSLSLCKIDLFSTFHFVTPFPFPLIRSPSIPPIPLLFYFANQTQKRSERNIKKEDEKRFHMAPHYSFALTLPRRKAHTMPERFANAKVFSAVRRWSARRSSLR